MMDGDVGGHNLSGNCNVPSHPPSQISDRDRLTCGARSKVANEIGWSLRDGLLRTLGRCHHELVTRRDWSFEVRDARETAYLGSLHLPGSRRWW
ncbi:hypothetical protein ACRALDRAFT_1092403 [Sodiomyces alcalophilus JCM 7366]|uniref:uncharacterized protein n=1 Tax=Sodiomyces alcalophilus JCM 7366 TaxID=591952 RepID=UPI0039B43E22